MHQSNGLPPGYTLCSEYVIDGVLGRGGFGITYEAHDIGLKRQVAIKEYFPKELAERTARATLAPRSPDNVAAIDWGRRRFFAEQQTIAQFKHGNIVRVSRVFEANDTAYAVMDFEPGETLRVWLERLGRPVTQAELDQVARPMLDALAVVHAKEGLLHRDVSPDNIILRPDGSPVLIDFGAAKDIYRQDQVASVYAIVKHGFSPIEQYSTDVSQQGAWTDIYSFAATLYFALTGRDPPKASDRIVRDTMPPATDLAAKGYRPAFLRAIDAGLAVHHTDRPQTIAAFRARLYDGSTQAPPTRPEPHPDFDGARWRPDDMSSATGAPGTTPRTVRYRDGDFPDRDQSIVGRDAPVARRPPGGGSVWLIAFAVVAVALLAFGVAMMTIPGARGSLISALPASWQCTLAASQCAPDARKDAFDAAVACLDRTAACDVVDTCLRPFERAYGGDNPSGVVLRTKTEAVSSRCIAVPAEHPSSPTPAPGASLPPLGQSAALGQYEACIMAAPCNQTACRAALLKRIDSPAQRQDHDKIEKVAATGLATCHSQREASAFAELGACMASSPCAFERECLADYEAATETANRAPRATAIADFRTQAAWRCSTPKKP